MKTQLLAANGAASAARRRRDEMEADLAAAHAAYSQSELRVRDLVKLTTRQEAQQIRERERLARMATTMASLRMQNAGALNTEGTRGGMPSMVSRDGGGSGGGENHDSSRRRRRQRRAKLAASADILV